MVRIVRVFIRKTQYTPDDDLAFFGPPVPSFFVPKIEVDEVHISVLFTWDKLQAEKLAKSWESVAPVKIGGPAYCFDGMGGGEFIPGLFLKKGYVITSRGCLRKCRFCLVPHQEGKLRELPIIHPGPWLMDNNLLACSRKHIEKVFDMLEGQRNVKLLGGLDTRLLREWHVERLQKLNLKNVSVAYDDPKLYSYLETALSLLFAGGISHGVIRCFVLGGFFSWDTPEKAEDRCRQVLALGATPCAMFYRGPDEMVQKKPSCWSAWTNRWAWQPGVYAMAKREGLRTFQNREK